MADWQIRIQLDPTRAKVGIFAETMGLVWRVAKVAKVPKNADWQCFKRGTNYFFKATWERGKERWF